MDLQQVGLRHPAAELVRDIQRNRTGIPRRTFVAEGLFENNIVLRAGVAIETFLWCPEAAYSDEARTRSAELAARARRSYQISAKTLLRLAERPSPDGLISVARLRDWDPADLPLRGDALVLVADGVEIPGNLGTLIRTLDACAADCLVLTNRRTRLTHPKVLRASQGMSISVPEIEFDEVADAITWLKDRHFTVYLADADAVAGGHVAGGGAGGSVAGAVAGGGAAGGGAGGGVSYRDGDYAGRTALVVGSERYGVSPPWHQAGFRRVGIPMLGSADSLNVAISASVLLYEARARKNRW